MIDNLAICKTKFREKKLLFIFPQILIKYKDHFLKIYYYKKDF